MLQVNLVALRHAVWRLCARLSLLMIRCFIHSIFELKQPKHDESVRMRTRRIQPCFCM